MNWASPLCRFEDETDSSFVLIVRTIWSGFNYILRLVDSTWCFAAMNQHIDSFTVYRCFFGTNKRQASSTRTSTGEVTTSAGQTLRFRDVRVFRSISITSWSSPRTRSSTRPWSGSTFSASIDRQFRCARVFFPGATRCCPSDSSGCLSCSKNQTQSNCGPRSCSWWPSGCLALYRAVPDVHVVT